MKIKIFETVVSNLNIEHENVFNLRYKKKRGKAKKNQYFRLTDLDCNNYGVYFI